MNYINPAIECECGREHFLVRKTFEGEIVLVCIHCGNEETI